MQKLLLIVLIALALSEDSYDEKREDACFKLSQMMQRLQREEIQKLMESKPHLDASNLRSKLMEKAFQNCVAYITESEVKEILALTPAKFGKFSHLVPVIGNGLDSKQDLEVDMMFFKKRRDHLYKEQTRGSKRNEPRRHPRSPDDL